MTLSSIMIEREDATTVTKMIVQRANPPRIVVVLLQNIAGLVHTGTNFQRIQRRKQSLFKILYAFSFSGERATLSHFFPRKILLYEARLPTGISAADLKSRPGTNAPFNKRGDGMTALRRQRCPARKPQQSGVGIATLSSSAAG